MTSRLRLLGAGSVGALVAACTVSLDFGALDQGCPADTKLCDGDCVALDLPEYGCASEQCTRCSVENGRAGCSDSGQCAIESCNDGWKECDGTCVSISSIAFGCNRPQCEPCFVPFAAATCDSFGQCAIARCDDRRGNCDGNPTNGCETNLNEDIDHCGNCNTECPELAHARTFCGGANCQILVCDSGWGDCNDRDSDGCETNITTDSNCGECGVSCTGGTSCQNVEGWECQ